MAEAGALHFFDTIVSISLSAIPFLRSLSRPARVVSKSLSQTSMTRTITLSERRLANFRTSSLLMHGLFCSERRNDDCNSAARIKFRMGCDGYPVDSPSPNMLCFRYEFDTGLDNSVVCDRFDGHGLLC